MTVPYYLLFLAAVCIGLRALYGLLQLIETAKVGPGRAQDPPGTLAATPVGASTPYDWERDA